MEEKQNIEPNKLSTFSIVLIVIAFLFIVFAFFAPYLFTEFSWLTLDDDSPIGDTLGGIMNPFIAIGAAILTFLAFYMQFKANKQQREQFTQQLKEDKRQFSEEINEQRKQFERTQFENRFYEMIRLHKENVNELKIYIRRKDINGLPLDDEVLSGRQVFKNFMYELISIYIILDKEMTGLTSKTKLYLSYTVFFRGYKPQSIQILKKHTDNHNVVKILSQIKNKANKSLLGDNKITTHIANTYNLYLAQSVKHQIMIGQSAQLGHYFRHLYQTVKFVCNQNEERFNYEQKRNYIRILRAQLSDEEQALLFYNWHSGIGANWENDENKFFTDYRMIHNINKDLIYRDFKFDEILLSLNPNFKVETNRSEDPLFEFQDIIT
ncbi:hypothetical protein JCM19296_130 [Nonlabens ulvanivorans]|uniref:Phage abortive infection protein n=1 Tax=Nonlabens ulvanivorans TaxID=906888 RepID=A0A081D6K6_NONUL|nr:putative phage abortive infection protein [Nonlabens ulvanivorans]GAK74552.1 hypothetical protein JCM19296_130 [Nonlabens ulvanivorans]